MKSNYLYAGNTTQYKLPKMLESKAVVILLKWVFTPLYITLAAINLDTLKGIALLAVAVATWLWKEYHFGKDKRAHLKRMDALKERKTQLEIEEQELQILERRNKVNHQ